MYGQGNWYRRNENHWIAVFDLVWSFIATIMVFLFRGISFTAVAVVVRWTDWVWQSAFSAGPLCSVKDSVSSLEIEVFGSVLSLEIESVFSSVCEKRRVLSVM